METEDPDGVAVAALVETLSSPQSLRPLRKRFRLWTRRDGATISDERDGGLVAAIDGVNQQDNAPASSSGHAWLDGPLHDANATLHTATGHNSHDTEPCTEPDCTIPHPHGHRCPRCGPGTYGIVADVDD
jgi:hypothetical protein